MSMTRNQLRQRIVRNLGGGMVKTELCLEHIDDAINTARDLWIEWTMGDAKMEIFFLLMLEANKRVYNMPAGLVDVIRYDDKFGGVGDYGDIFNGYGPARWYTGPEAGSTAFFALDNGGWTGLGYNTASGSLYTMVDSYLALSHMELVKKMRHDKYQWRYHRFANQLEIIPTPEAGNELSVPTSAGYEYVDSPGWVMIRGVMLAGATLPTYTASTTGAIGDPDNRSMYPLADDLYLESIYSHPWIIEYATAYSMRTLGYIRRKFSSNTSLGNATISLDGSEMVSEGTERMKELEEELDLKYSDGFDISMG